MKKQKLNNKGITLIVLIISIVVLLILAIISIRVIEKSKIISYSQNAADAWEQGQENENKLLEGYIEQIESGIKADDNNGDDEIETKKDPISTTDTYIGYYADIDGDGIVEGIIYADLAVDGSGNGFGYASEIYKYSKKDTLNNYYISKNSYQYKSFEAKPVIAPIDLEDDTVEENDRFYVMALEDFVVVNSYEQFYWYTNADGLMNDIETTTSKDFGTGKTNTATMMNKVYGDGLKDGDLWKYINSEVEKGWFVPSEGEWGLFSDLAKKQQMTSSNYGDYGLSKEYWSSSQWNEKCSIIFHLLSFGRGASEVKFRNYVRLSTTF